MRLCVFTVLLTALTIPAFCQEPQSASSTTYTYDGAGRRSVAATQATVTGPGGSAHTETVVDMNGRRVPLEAAEETVLSDGPEGRVVERIVKKFDSQGRLTGQEKVRIEESKNADGSSSTVRATVYDRDLNGRFELRERSTTTTNKDGSTVNAETLIERPNANGRLDLDERKVVVKTGDENASLQDTTVFRKDQHGAFSAAVREVTETKKEGERTVANTSQYNSASTGKMELVGQKLSQAVKNADGSETVVEDVFGTHNPGQVSSGYNKEPKLRERRLIERVPANGKGHVETFSVQRPSIDGGRLGDPQKVSETVCTGNCRP